MLSGWIHKIRTLGGINFLILRDKEGLIQTILPSKEKITGLTNESVVSIIGQVIGEKRAPGGMEVKVEDLIVLSSAENNLPIEINKEKIPSSLDTILENRTLTLRNLGERNIFKVQGKTTKAFRDFFLDEGFVEIHSPKIVSQGAETSGAEMFKVDYFGKKTYLSQSPQLYKQMMVGVYEKVFEVAPVFRAELHNTTRHLNEYLSLDIEIGFISTLEDLLLLHQKFIEYLINHLKNTCQEEFKTLKADFPQIVKTPSLKLEEAQKILEKEYQEKASGLLDLTPGQEELICQYARGKWKSDFVFITHFPAKKRPFYTMDDPKAPQQTLSFDCLFRGLEITTGGLRINKYQDYLAKMKKFNINPQDFKEYLDIFRYGMPPHGGFAIGLERLTMKLLGLKNIREACLFPRDLSRLKP